MWRTLPGSVVVWRPPGSSEEGQDQKAGQHDTAAGHLQNAPNAQAPESGAECCPHPGACCIRAWHRSDATPRWAVEPCNADRGTQATLAAQHLATQHLAVPRLAALGAA